MEQIYQELMNSLCESAYEKFAVSSRGEALWEDLQQEKKQFQLIKNDPNASGWLDAAASYASERGSFLYRQGFRDSIALLRLLGVLG